MTPRWVWAGVAATVLASCPGPKPVKPDNGPELPTNFVPPPPLGAEPKPDGAAPGAEWLAAIHPRFHERWAESFLEDARVYLPPDHPLNDPKLAVTISFGVAADGKLLDASVATPSGNGDFDGAALEVVRESAPFPPPFVELASDDGVTHVAWLFARDERQDGVATARIEGREWEPARAVPALLRAGRFGDACNRIASALEQQPPDAAALIDLARQTAGVALETALVDPDDAGVRLEAARALGQARWTRAAADLRRLAREASDLRLQKAAATALGALGDSESEPILLELVATLDGDRSAAAAAALAALGKGDAAWARVQAKLVEKDARVRAAVLATLAEVGAPSSTDALRKILEDKGAARTERAAAAHALARLAAAEPTGSAAKALTAALADGDATIRAAAAAALARAGRAGLRSKAIYYKVEPLLRDKDPRVRAGAALAAAHLYGASADDELILLARKERDATVLAACAEGLGVTPSAPEAVEALAGLAAKDAPDVRLAALRALAARTEEAARAKALAYATDGDARARSVVAALLTDRGAIEAAMSDDDPDVRAAAARAWARSAGVPAALPAILRLVGAAPAGRDRVILAEALLGATRTP